MEKKESEIACDGNRASEMYCMSGILLKLFVLECWWYVSDLQFDKQMWSTNKTGIAILGLLLAGYNAGWAWVKWQNNMYSRGNLNLIIFSFPLIWFESSDYIFVFSWLFLSHFYYIWLWLKFIQVKIENRWLFVWVFVFSLLFFFLCLFQNWINSKYMK